MSRVPWAQLRDAFAAHDRAVADAARAVVEETRRARAQGESRSAAALRELPALVAAALSRGAASVTLLTWSTACVRESQLSHAVAAQLVLDELGDAAEKRSNKESGGVEWCVVADVAKLRDAAAAQGRAAAQLGDEAGRAL